MGLDVYASRTPWFGDDDDEIDGDLTWCDKRAFRRAKIDIGQLNEPGTFFGRSHWQLVQRACDDVGLELGYDLWDHDVHADLPWINAATVRLIADALDRCNPHEVAAAASGLWREFTPDHVEGFRRFFRVCATRGLGLIYWT